MLRVLSILFFFVTSGARADVVDVPLLPDGAVDVDMVLSTFHVSSPVLEARGSNVLTGAILGKSFSASHGVVNVASPFDLTIRSADLSEHAYFVTALLLNDIICMRHELAPNRLLWAETASRIDGGWHVQASCSGRDHQAGETGSR